jgi:hypothetical protein
MYALVVVGASSMLARLRHAGRLERQQIKWFAYATTIVISGVILKNVVYPPVGIVWVWWIGLILTAIGVVSSPIAMALAILRYRLYQIDLLINRTLVYGSLTASLVALYFAVIVVLQRLFVVLIGEQSTLAVVASTLVIAALFNPFRHRIQSVVDRRFYRRKYDARKTLEAFSASLRDETDLDALSHDLVDVVSETMQPPTSLCGYTPYLFRGRATSLAEGPSHEDRHATRIIRRGLGEITALDDPIVRGRRRRSQRL